jgi:hypothetical protein
MIQTRFLWFMGCFKCDDQLTSDVKQRGQLETKDAKVHSVVPRKVLQSEVQDEAQSPVYKTPGILHQNINLFRDNKTASAKMCINGTKCANGFDKLLGDVNLYGRESSPTLKELQ